MTVPGRTTVSGRALAAVVRAETARVLEVAPTDVGVDFEDRAGRLDLRLKTPLPMPPLTTLRHDPSRAGGGLLARAGRAESGIREGFERITGRRLSRLVIEATTAHVTEGRRVR
jgi:hypothetical protein